MKEQIASREDLIATRDRCRAEGRKVGFTSGVFDILHPGHVQYLADAKSLVDVLIVGVNSDSSVRANKGDTRPICSERDRATVIAALASVDHVFIFSEHNNNKNIEMLQPDLYIKAGDYAPERLSSREIVEQYGGQVAIVPFSQGLSSTKVIEKIAAATLTKEGQAIVPERRPAVFVDRDGTINEHIEYLSEPGRFRELPGSFAALQKMRQLGYRIIVVTNQPGIGLGYFTKEDFYAVNREMLRQATAAGCSIDRIYFCPHSKSDNCKCRKPSPYLLQRAAAECNVDLSRSFMIGDMTSDIQLAVNAGCKGILVKTGRGGDDGLFSVHADAEVQDLADAVAVIAAQGPVVLEPGSPIARSSRVVVGEHVEPSNTAGRSSAELWGAVLGCAALIDQKTRDTSGRSPIETTLTLLRKAVGRGIALSKAAQEGSSARICAEVVRDVVLEAHGASCEVEVCCVKDATKISGQVSLADLMVEMVENLLEGRHDETAPYVAIHIDVVAVGTEGKKLELKPGSYARISFSDTRGAPAQMVDEELFNPFLSQRLRSAGRGLGATLASARSVLKGEGGSVSLATRVDRGITVSLYMPSA